MRTPHARVRPRTVRSGVPPLRAVVLTSVPGKEPRPAGFVPVGAASADPTS